MSFYRFPGDVGVSLTPEGWNSVSFAAAPAPPPPPPPSSITPQLVGEYVDTDGNLQTVTINPDGSTVINAVAPFLVTFDATGTRSTAKTTQQAAWWELGFRMDWAEALGGTWPFSGASRDADYGEPLFARAFTQTGTRTPTLQVAESTPGDQASVPFTLTLSAPPAPTIIEVAAGAWPTFTSGSHYQLRAGGDYRSFGTLACPGLHNILFSKIGEGADPLIATFAPENRGNSTTVLTPARNIRIMDIDCEQMYMSIIGLRYCGAIRGRVRTMGNDAPAFYYDQADVDTAGERENLRYPRGVFLWDCGEINPPSGQQYIMISAYRWLVASGVDFNKNGATGNHGLRNSGEKHLHQHCRLRASVASASLIKIQAGSGTTPWNAGDQYGTITGGKGLYAYPTSQIVYRNMAFHASGSVLPDIAMGASPENNDIGGQLGAVEYVAFSNSTAFHPTLQLVAGNDVQMNGRVLSTRNLRLDNGTGGYATQSAGTFSNNVPEGWTGPYLYETINSRPVPA